VSFQRQKKVLLAFAATVLTRVSRCVSHSSFSDSLPQATGRVEKAQRDLDAAESQHADLTAKLAEAQAARPTSQSRSTDLKRLAQLKAQAAELEAEVAKFADSDPDRLKLLGQSIRARAASRGRDRDRGGTGAGAGADSERRRSLERSEVLGVLVMGCSAHGSAGGPSPTVEGDAIGRGQLCSLFFRICFLVIVWFCLSLCSQGHGSVQDGRQPLDGSVTFQRAHRNEGSRRRPSAASPLPLC